MKPEVSIKVSDRLTDNPDDNNYLNSLPLHSSRLWFRYRARAIKGVKYNCKGSFSDLSCRFCDKKETETQEHLESCEGNSYERRGLKKLADRDWKDTLKFWERMCIKLERRKTEEQTNKKKKEEAQNEASEEEKDNNSTVNIVINVAAVVSDHSLT